MRVLIVAACVLAGTVTPGLGFGQPTDKSGLSVRDVDLFALDVLNPDLVEATYVIKRYDLNHDLKLDQLESRNVNWQIDPSEFDLNTDGNLTKVEVIIYFSFLRRASYVEATDLQVSKGNLNRYDLNKDDVLSAFEIKQANWPEEPEAYDKDGDGTLTWFELAARNSVERRGRAERGISGYDQGLAIHFVERFDISDDKRIDGDEFRAAVGLTFPTSSDANGDGLLSSDEIAAIFATRRKEEGIIVQDQQEAARYMYRFDKNKDRMLDKEEVLTRS